MALKSHLHPGQNIPTKKNHPKNLPSFQICSWRTPSEKDPSWSYYEVCLARWWFVNGMSLWCSWRTWLLMLKKKHFFLVPKELCWYNRCVHSFVLRLQQLGIFYRSHKKILCFMCAKTFHKIIFIVVLPYNTRTYPKLMFTIMFFYILRPNMCYHTIFVHFLRCLHIS